MSIIKSPAKIKTVEQHFPPGYVSTELLVGEKVFCLLDDPAFIDEWDHLFKVCPWATAFQSSSYVVTWYRVFGKEFLPILIKAGCDGKLTGLLTLAKFKNGLITGAGAMLAEYQAWLTADANDETFIKNALLEMDRHFPNKKIQFKYIPAGVPFEWTKNDPEWRKRCILKTFRHPLMIINDLHLSNELNKRKRKEKMNRLNRLGELKFERICDYKKFASVFDQLALQSDFRKGAMYNKTPFKSDPLRKIFYLTLFEQNNLHATVLKHNGKIIASNVSVLGNNMLYLQGINSMASLYAKYSPGIIHFLLLGKLMAEEGLEVFDLTPGGDIYKDMLATDYKVAYTLTVGNDHYVFANRLKSLLNKYFMKTIGIAGIKSDTLKRLKRNINDYKVKCRNAARQGFTSLGSFLFDKLKRQRKTTKCWVGQKVVKSSTSRLLKIQKDNLEDLLKFDNRETKYTQQEFLADSMRRIESEEHYYSWVEDGVLLGCAWISKTDGFFISLSGLYCHSKYRKRCSDFFKSVAAEWTVEYPHEKLYIVTDCNEDRVFETNGFRPIEVTR